MTDIGELGARLHAELAAVAPIVGVAVIDVEAKRARVDYAIDATDADRKAGDAALATFDWSDAAQQAHDDAKARETSKTFLDSPMGLPIRAALAALVDQVNELRAEVKLPAITLDDISAVVSQKVDTVAVSKQALSAEL